MKTEIDPTVNLGKLQSLVSNDFHNLGGTDQVGITSETDPTVPGSVKDGITWIEVSNRPAGLDDGDNVGITSETDPTVLASVKDGISWSEVSNRPAGLDDGDQVGITSETDPTVPASVKDGITWSEVSNRPAGLDDGDDVGITIESDPQVGINNTNYIPKWNGSALVSGTIYDSGNVGIGTASPTAKLEVNGPIKTAGIYETYVMTNWTSVESNRLWWSVAMSADGTKQTAVCYSGQIYVSTDSGNTWTAKESNRGWQSVAMSADGTIQTALADYIYISTDSGNTWTAKESNRYWRSVAMSADETKQTAVVRNGQIYISTDSGNTWTAKESNRDWLSVAMSADGTKQSAVVWGGQIYISTDSGNTWTAKESNQYWRSVAMSADGTKQTAVFDNGQIYISTDSGNTWTAKESNREWFSVAMSADGTKQTAVVRNGQIYISTDSGNTWIAKESNRSWYSVAMSADGSKQTTVVHGGQIYIGISYIGVGIGTTSPTEKLDVGGNIRTGQDGSGGQLILAAMDSGAEGGEITWNGAGAYDNWAQDVYENNIRFFTSSTNNNQVRIFNASSGYAGLYVQGNVGIGTAGPSEKLDVDGTARLRGIAAGSGTTVVADGNGKLWKSSSSQRYKTNIEQLDADTDAVLQLRPVRFQWKTTGQNDVGLIAEEVEQQLNDLVIYDNEGRPDGVKYDKVALHLLGVVKAQQEKIAELERRVETLENTTQQIKTAKEVQQ